MREDTVSSIKKSISRRRNYAAARNLVMEDSEFYEEAASSCYRRLATLSRGVRASLGVRHQLAMRMSHRRRARQGFTKLLLSSAGAIYGVMH